ncbi:MAG: hypothetical protein V4520_09165 [Bacteroidota bacterium]
MQPFIRDNVKKAMIKEKTFGQSILKSKSAVLAIFILGNLMVIGLLVLMCIVL